MDATTERLLRRLLRGIAQGAALATAACVTDDGGSGRDAGAAGVDAATDAAAGAEAGTDATALATDAAAHLPPVPDIDRDCDRSGDDDPEALEGPCCPEVRCADPPAGADCVDAASDEYAAAELVGFQGLGSGTCLCDSTGPFDPASAAAYTDTTGRCCYVVSTNWCTGRPIRVAGEARLARVVGRGDWT